MISADDGGRTFDVEVGLAGDAGGWFACRDNPEALGLRFGCSIVEGFGIGIRGKDVRFAD